MSRVQGIARLRKRAAGPMPFRRRKTYLRELSGTLLSAESPRTGEGGHALCRAANAVEASDLEHSALGGRNAEGFRHLNKSNSSGNISFACRVQYRTELDEVVLLKAINLHQSDEYLSKGPASV